MGIRLLVAIRDLDAEGLGLVAFAVGDGLGERQHADGVVVVRAPLLARHAADARVVVDGADGELRGLGVGGQRDAVGHRTHGHAVLAAAPEALVGVDDRQLLGVALADAAGLRLRNGKLVVVLRKLSCGRRGHRSLPPAPVYPTTRRRQKGCTRSVDAPKPPWLNACLLPLAW